MWTCPRCGEANEDTFKECWKCISDELQQGVTATPPPPPAPPRRVRSLGSVLLRMAFAFAIGTLIGLAVFHRNMATLAEAAFFIAMVGVGCAGIVGVLLWAVFPYEPDDSLRDLSDEPEL